MYTVMEQSLTTITAISFPYWEVVKHWCSLTIISRIWNNKNFLANLKVRLYPNLAISSKKGFADFSFLLQSHPGKFFSLAVDLLGFLCCWNCVGREVKDKKRFLRQGSLCHFLTAHCLYKKAFLKEEKNNTGWSAYQAKLSSSSTVSFFRHYPNISY